MRITNQWVYNSFVNQINRNNTSLSELESKISSGNKYLRASENPVDNALTMEYSSEINENKQYVRNIEHTKDWYITVRAAIWYDCPVKAMLPKYAPPCSIIVRHHPHLLCIFRDHIKGFIPADIQGHTHSPYSAVLDIIGNGIRVI